MPVCLCIIIVYSLFLSCSGGFRTFDLMQINYEPEHSESANSVKAKLIRIRMSTGSLPKCIRLILLLALSHFVKYRKNRPVTIRNATKSPKFPYSIIVRDKSKVNDHCFIQAHLGGISPQTSNSPPKNLRRGLLLCECNTCKLTECSKLTK